jgi:twitching motility two-component system response regulator PilH
VPETGTKTVLVIDDDPDFVGYVDIILSANGYRVCTADGAARGLEMARLVGPDLVMVDLMMSYGLAGNTVTRELARDPALKDIPVLMVSAIVSDCDDEIVPRGEDAHVDAFMVKPLDPSELLVRVAELVGEPPSSRRER